jgi:tetratricopeptide (TPR) repeat protein
MLLGLLLMAGGALETARDAQDRAALDKLVAESAAAADRQSKDAAAQYQAALAASYAAEVALEKRDKAAAQRVADGGIRYAERAVALDAGKAEHYRVLGTLCGQVIPANVLAGLRYGRRAQEAIEKAIQLDPKSAQAHLARGVGNYYLPPFMGGGSEVALKDFRKAAALDPKLAEAHFWIGLALRKLNRNGEARNAFGESLKLNPRRLWVKEQLDKTPAS